MFVFDSYVILYLHPEAVGAVGERPAGEFDHTAVTVEIDTLSPRHNRILSPKTGIVLV